MTLFKHTGIELKKDDSGPSEWVDLRTFPTHRTLYLGAFDVPASRREGARVDHLARIEVSPDRKIVVDIGLVHTDVKASKTVTDFDYAWARIIRVPNGTGTERVEKGCSWELVVVAADEEARERRDRERGAEGRQRIEFRAGEPVELPRGALLDLVVELVKPGDRASDYTILRGTFRNVGSPPSLETVQAALGAPLGARVEAGRLIAEASGIAYVSVLSPEFRV